jgi:hypothetical protein
MASYKVLSDNCTLGVQGSTITDKDLAGISVDALVDGGHLEEVVSNRIVKEQDLKKENN